MVMLMVMMLRSDDEGWGVESSYGSYRGHKRCSNHLKSIFIVTISIAKLVHGFTFYTELSKASLLWRVLSRRNLRLWVLPQCSSKKLLLFFHDFAANRLVSGVRWHELLLTWRCQQCTAAQLMSCARGVELLGTFVQTGGSVEKRFR